MASKRKREEDSEVHTMASKKKTSNKEATSDSVSSFISQPMSIPQRKAMLKQLQSPQIISSLRRPEILMDFFTDSLNMSDLSLSVPALTGLFHLISTRNLDYPSFYTRLYGLLDGNLLHSKYRSRVMRHLNTFLSPQNHLSSSIIASFIKRLSRLCLYAPPSATVAVIPFIYNLLKTHPATTFLIHRHPYPPYTKTKSHLGVDPYSPSEPNPQYTNAIDSSLWELHTLQSHYHPTVSQIARIISEQFTKQRYNLDDFLDHGYGTMMDSELAKEPKKDPVVEYKIPRRIFFPDDDDENKPVQVNSTALATGEGRDLIRELWSFG